jgi:hypothetical protein
MAKRPTTLEWCIVRLGNDHNWWVEEVSDPVRWDVDGLTVIDPRQLNHIIELLDQLRDYGFDPELFERAFASCARASFSSSPRKNFSHCPMCSTRSTDLTPIF